MKTKRASQKHLAFAPPAKVFFLSCFFAVISFFDSCDKIDLPYPPPHTDKKYDADVALDWINLQAQLTKVTPGWDPAASVRSFAYSGITLYESILPNIPGGKSYAGRAAGLSALPLSDKNLYYYWPASANAAMASIIKNLFGNASPASFTTIDSLENAYNQKFVGKASTDVLQRSAYFGKLIAIAIFDWSKTDGNDKPYVSPFDPTYVPPTGPGKWIPTPPAYLPPVRVHLGDTRSIIPGVAAAVLPGAPIPYSESPKSAFYNMVYAVYAKSKHLTNNDTILAKTWAASTPGNFNEGTHFEKVLTQLVAAEKFSLDKAAIAFAKNGIALNDAGIAVFKAKYIYNLIRPISYIRNVMGYADWNAVVPTPPHPEYPAAHATSAAASAAVLQSIFGINYSFTDHTNDAILGPYHYNSFSDYAYKAGYSRFVGGIHYMPSIDTGFVQGKKVGNMAIQL